MVNLCLNFFKTIPKAFSVENYVLSVENVSNKKLYFYYICLNTDKYSNTLKTLTSSTLINVSIQPFN